MLGVCHVTVGVCVCCAVARNFLHVNLRGVNMHVWVWGCVGAPMMCTRVMCVWCVCVRVRARVRVRVRIASRKMPSADQTMWKHTRVQMHTHTTHARDYAHTRTDAITPSNYACTQTRRQTHHNTHTHTTTTIPRGAIC